MPKSARWLIGAGYAAAITLVLIVVGAHYVDVAARALGGSGAWLVMLLLPLSAALTAIGTVVGVTALLNDRASFRTSEYWILLLGVVGVVGGSAVLTAGRWGAR